MRGKNVILVTMLFMVAVSICGMAYGQGGPVLLGTHSPAMVYSPLTKSFMSVCQVYQGYFLNGTYIDPWGNTRGGFTPAWNSGVDDEWANPAITYDTVNERSLTVWTGHGHTMTCMGNKIRMIFLQTHSSSRMPLGLRLIPW